MGVHAKYAPLQFPHACAFACCLVAWRCDVALAPRHSLHPPPHHRVVDGSRRCVAVRVLPAGQRGAETGGKVGTGGDFYGPDTNVKPVSSHNFTNPRTKRASLRRCPPRRLRRSTARLTHHTLCTAPTPSTRSDAGRVLRAVVRALPADDGRVAKGGTAAGRARHCRCRQLRAPTAPVPAHEHPRIPFRVPVRDILTQRRSFPACRFAGPMRRRRPSWSCGKPDPCLAPCVAVRAQVPCRPPGSSA